ncbi:MAG: tetratricopeptide repeat protein, partial [Sandaracinaceae bacterium]|nr:tetratricopeptide repeat protein [Sandaracinaceae bacterium]
GGVAGVAVAPDAPDATGTTSGAALTAADAGAPPAAPLEYQPIPPDVLSNDDPPRLGDVIAPDGEPWVEISSIHDDPEVALARAVRTLEDTPRELDALVLRAHALFALRRNDEGLVALRALEQAHPDEPTALSASGYVEMRRGRLDEADARFTRALERDPAHAGALRHRGILRVRRGRTRDGYVDLQRVLALDPDNLHALAEMTQIYEHARRPLDAVPFLRRILAGHPRNATGWVSLGIALSSSEARADVEEAIQATERGLELNPTHEQGLALRCTLLSRHERAGAAAACTEAIRVRPRDPDLFMARALDLARRGEHVPALADADRAVELAPDLPRNYANRAILRGRSGDDGGAYADLRVACRLGHPRSCAQLVRAGVDP